MTYTIKRSVDTDFYFVGNFEEFKTQLNPTPSDCEPNDPYIETYEDWEESTEISELIDLLNRISDFDDFFVYHQEDSESVHLHERI